MLYDLLFGLKKIQGGGAVKKIIMGYKTRLDAELVKLKVRGKVKNDIELIPKHLRMNILLPRYVRINLILATREEVLEILQGDKWELIENSYFHQILAEAQKEVDNGENVFKSISALRSKKKFCVDKHFEDILVFPPMTDFHDHILLKNGKIVLQDKASALSGYALNPPPKNIYCLDACAAPGQKTSQLAQSMKNYGVLFAIDQDKRRLETLKKLTKRNGATNIQPINKSFLDIDPMVEPYCNVQYILLDPSCSGSGIINRFDYLLSSSSEAGSFNDLVSTQEDEMSRVKSLAEFQRTMILHAFKFPRVQKVVYSTCSIHDEENEQVVEEVLKLSDIFEIEKVLPQFESRGKSEYPHGELCVRTDPQKDLTIGFFVSIFSRKPGTEISLPTIPPTVAPPKKTKKRKKPTKPIVGPSDKKVKLG